MKCGSCLHASGVWREDERAGNRNGADDMWKGQKAKKGKLESPSHETLINPP
jgi:hypothetical protein